jgi:hypothetical protein
LEWALQVDTVPGEYSGVVALLEAQDSSIILTDPLERTAWAVDLALKVRREFGARGDGPGEYRLPSGLARVHSDSVALLQGSIRKPFPVLSDRSGKGRSHVVERLDVPGRGLASANGLSVPLLKAADTVGHVYAARTMIEMVADKQGRRVVRGAKSYPIIRYAMDGSGIDTLAILPTGWLLPPSVHNEDGSVSAWIPRGPYAAMNGWQVVPDGRLLLIDAAAYRVQVLGVDGNERAKWQRRVARIPASPAGWDAYIERMGGAQQRALDRAARITQLPVGQRSTRFPSFLAPEKPDFLPPVAFSGESSSRSALVFGDWVFIPVNASDPPTVEYWDVLELATGRLIVTLSLPERHRLIHVGRLGAYVVSKNADHLERILLFTMPSRQ